MKSLSSLAETSEKASRIIVLGDIHGCSTELDTMLTRLAVGPTDLLVYVGDLIHKGPDSALVVEIAAETAKIVPTVLVWGNHEEKHWRWMKHEAACAITGKKNPMRHCEEFSSIQFSDEGLEFLKTGVAFYRFPEHVVVHGGINSRITNMDTALTGVELANTKHENWEQREMFRLRYQDVRGHMVSLGDEKPSDSFWASTYDGRFGRAIFGHQPFLSGPKQYPNAIGIDTGCVYGATLTAYVYVPATKQATLHSLQAQQVYCERHKLMQRNPENE